MDFKKMSKVERGVAPQFMPDFVWCREKIDGTNASVWVRDGKICAGSRNRELSLDDDNAGFYKYVSSNKKLTSYLVENPGVRLYGEWLVPHTVRYKEDKYRKFYLFLLTEEVDGTIYYNSLEELEKIAKEVDVEVAPIVGILYKPTHEQIKELANRPSNLTLDGRVGEGIVYTALDATLVKVISDDFRNGVHKRENRIKREKEIYNSTTEQEFLNERLTAGDVYKELAKLKLEQEWNVKLFGKLIGMVSQGFFEDFHDEIIKNTEINVQYLKKLIPEKIKELVPDILER